MSDAKSRFLTPLIVEKLVDRQWMLRAPLVYQTSYFLSVEPPMDDFITKITVPAGFVTDFASVPRVPLGFAMFGNKAHAAATVHDWLYQNHASTKEEADLVFWEAMELERLSDFERFVMWMGVHLFGRPHWRSGPDRLKILNPKMWKETITDEREGTECSS